MVDELFKSGASSTPGLKRSENVIIRGWRRAEERAVFGKDIGRDDAYKRPDDDCCSGPLHRVGGELPIGKDNSTEPAKEKR